MAASTNETNQIATARETYDRFMTWLKWSGVAVFIVAAFVVYLIH